MALNLSYEPEAVVSTEGLTEDDWLDYRRRGIGGSDVAAVMGFSPFCTTRDLWYDKRGIRPAVEDQPNWVTLKIGHLLEPLVAEIFSAKTGYRTFQIHKMFRHPLFPWMQADVDYFIETPDGRQGILECKTSNPNNREKWADDSIPLNYEWQCRHYMAVMNLDFVWIACLFSNTDSDFVMRRIDRDLDIEAELIAAEDDFWNGFVKAGIEPPYTEKGDMVLESIRRHFGPSDPSAAPVSLSRTMQISLDTFLALREKKMEHDRLSKQIDGEMKKAIAPVLDDMGTAEKAVLALPGAQYEVAYASKYRAGVSKENLERLRRDQPAVYDEYVTQSESRSATVRRKEA